MDKATFDALKAQQAAHFAELLDPGTKKERSRGQYQQRLMAGGYAIDVYDGPQGKGYVVREERQVLGVTERKSTNVGPETWRDHDWRPVIAKQV